MARRKDAWTRLDPRDREAIGRILAPVVRRYGADVWLFGSRARGDARRASDIDVALRAPTPVPPDVLAGVREALEESHIPFRVDLVDYRSAAEGLQRAIDAEGVAWIG
ncbi:Nucleotidyltransferase domain protein [Tepidimonas thermarum]|uniref:Nucleotidyltransferase domain protein n=1 Tax=Tepidimonas thermarum TaxID=335431 RepID=A0A554WXA8_9BURK|nr:nucleotidyltransferase domain-containing protein [Tepidimonas thermarum]TSE28210.1 Nucleotidyltransferase domain protein [Tepidimonas thermarum]